MTALIASLILFAAPKYPLATVFVREGEIWLSELGNRNERHLPSPGLTADSAALNITRTKVAFTARRELGAPERLYLLDVASGAAEELATGLAGPHHGVAFSGDGKRVFFSAAAGVNPGPEQPTKIRVWNVTGKRLEEIPATDGAGSCEYSPAPRANDVLHVSTNCFGNFMIDATPMAGKSKTWAPRKVSSPQVEIAASFDGSRFVYTSAGPAGLSLVLQKNKGEPKVVAVLPANTVNVQPRFVCPRDVMFLREGRAIVLNTDTEEMVEAALATSGKSAGTEKH